MYDNYSMPDPRFYKLYANKFRDMHSLRTEDIDGAQPKKQTYDRNDFLNKYYDKVVSHNQVVQSNGPKNLNYWSLPQQDLSNSPVRQKGGMSYNGSTAQMNYSKPEDYHLPNNYKIPQRQNPAPMNQYPGQYQQQQQQQQQYPPQQYGGNQGGYSGNSSAIRNPMYSDFDYNNRQVPQYQNSPQRSGSKGGNNIYVRDSLDALQMQYGGNNNSYQASPQYPPQNQNNQAEQNFKKDWLNFYGVESAPAQKQQSTVKQNQNQNQTPVKQQDPTIRASAAKFYGEGPSEEDQFQKNLHAFYGADNSLPVRNVKGSLAGAHKNALNKGAKLYNPLIHAPMLHYAKDPSKFEQPKVKDVREQWQFKQNLQKFFDV